MIRTLLRVWLAFVVAPFIASEARAFESILIQGPAAEQVLHLGAKRAISLTVTAGPDFRGTVDFAADLSDLVQADPKGTVTAEFEPAQVRLAPGQSASVKLEVSASTLAPTISGRRLGVNAKGVSTTGTTTAAQQISLSVDAIYEVRLYGGPSPESWDSLKTAAFSPHSEGVLVRFINMDTVDSHVIHSSGPIPHGDTSAPLKAAAATGREGGIYEYRVTGTAAMKDQYYCHLHENGGPETRTLLFNQ